MTGRVFLVGAGPGDPGLLTLRGRRCLEEADVVIHDDLVPMRLLDFARPGAARIAAGPLHGGAGRLSQSEIEALLVTHARAGRTVVRLKNGDPFLLARGAEEALALEAAGIPFEIVPGVTSPLAVAAYAGIPTTHRAHASLVTIVTGHQASPSGAPPALPWEALARLQGTLVFLMGMRQLPTILRTLVAHGLSGTTPAAAIERGTTGRQRTVVGTVATLAERVAAERLGPPAVVVLGEVVRLRARLAWFEQRPLFGRRIVVTRARAQADDLTRLLEDRGADVIVFPTIAIEPAPDPAAFDRAVATAAEYDWIAFTSANGVRAFFDRLAEQRRDVRELARVAVAAIGPETAAALERLLVRPAVVPREYRAEGLLAAFADHDLRGRRVLLPRAAGARAILPDTLAARGAHVDEVIAYRAVVPPDTDIGGLRAALEAGAVDAVTFTSSSTVRNFVELLGAEALGPMRGGRPAVACIGPVTAETARAMGLPVTVQPSTYTVVALADALTRHLGLSQAAQPSMRERAE